MSKKRTENFICFLIFQKEKTDKTSLYLVAAQTFFDPFRNVFILLLFLFFIFLLHRFRRYIIFFSLPLSTFSFWLFRLEWVLLFMKMWQSRKRYDINTKFAFVFCFFSFHSNKKEQRRKEKWRRTFYVHWFYVRLLLCADELKQQQLNISIFNTNIKNTSVFLRMFGVATLEEMIYYVKWLIFF